MRRCDPDNAAYYDERSRVLLDIIMEKFYHEDMETFFETVAADGSFMDNSMGRTISPGHALEAAWFMIREAQYFKDEEIIEYMNRLLHENYKMLLPGLGIVGRSRGGYSYYGSCVWADVSEHVYRPSSKLFDNTYQVFGHTQLRENAIFDNDFACLDCRAGFRLTDKGEFIK
jgi:hypothetical protein